MMYEKKVGSVCVQTARLCKLPSGRFAFETSLFGEKPYELNMNMPLFKTSAAAYRWIEHSAKWRKVK